MILCGTNYDEAVAHAKQMATEQRLTYLSAFNDAAVITLRSNGSTGSYSSTRLPPGSYQAVAFEGRHSANYRDPASLAPFSSHVHSVTVSAGAERSVAWRRVLPFGADSKRPASIKAKAVCEVPLTSTSDLCYGRESLWAVLQVLPPNVCNN